MTMIFEILFTTIFGLLFVYFYKWQFTGNVSESLTHKEIKHKQIIVSGGSAKSTDFDFSLLYKLIRNTFNNKIPPPTRGWGHQPLSGDQLISDDIERIRYYRNSIAHNTELKINNQEFQDQWKVLSQAINRLSQGALKAEISALQCTTFIGSQINEIKHMTKDICKMKDEVYQLQNEMIVCQDEMKDIKDNVIYCRRDIDETRNKHIPDHIRESQLRILKDWKRHDIVFCNKTRGYKEAYDEVNKEQMVTFIGGPGSGKTVTGRHIALLSKSAKIMFPFLCQLFAAIVKYQMFGSDFFERPFDYLLEELSRLQKTNTAQYASLVLCLVNDRKLSMENLPSKNVKKRIYNSCGLDGGTADRKIIDALSHIEGTYVVLIESEYSFIHDSIYEAIAFHYGQVFPEQILDYMPSNFIANKVTVFGNASYDALSIQITEKHVSKLAERVYSDIESYQLFDVFMNKALKYEPFLDVFIQLIRKKPYKDFHKTFLGHKFSFFGDCDHLINSQGKNEEAGYTYYDETFKRELLTDKREGDIEDKNLRYIIHRILVISWIDYYGHIRLLQEIVNHVHDHKESTDLVFGSDKEEQAILLVLSVYNGDPGLVELVLKYVKKESISSTSMYMDDDFLEANHHRTLSPLTAACQFNNFQIVKLLVRAGADVNLGDFAYEFPIYVASENGYYEIVKYLVQHGADVNKNIPNMYMISGCVPSLYIAAIQGYYDIVKCLL